MPKKKSESSTTTTLSRNRPKRPVGRPKKVQSNNDVLSQLSSPSGESMSTSTTGSDYTTSTQSSANVECLPVPLSTKIKNSIENEEESFEEILNRIPGYSNLTAELDETTGNMRQFFTESPEMQDLEKDYLDQLRIVKREAEFRYKKYVLDLESALKMSNPKELFEMSVESVVKIFEKVQGAPVQSSDWMKIMLNMNGTEVAKHIPSEDQKYTHVLDEGDEDMFADVDPLPPRTPQQNGSKMNNCEFPSNSKMAHNVKGQLGASATPAVFTFGTVCPPSTNKAPRPVKAGEMLFSQSGSPLMLPRLAGVPAKGNLERIPLNDNDGKKLLEVVLYCEDRDKLKKLRDDARGFVATQSIKKDRIRPPRIPRAQPPSTSKQTPSSVISKKSKPWI